ncbi:hypothetical protein ACIQXI_20905 [Lysinibacillus sp. NPDC097195]|uniref:hypothetical protein n=1 Tax=Lysinibacillus sp. NPDC097195 TaxID=3364141 RepID=UPI003817FF20
MFKIKAIAAVLTIITGIFIIPLFITSAYSIVYGIYGTIFTAPSMIVALVVSLLIEKYSKNKNILFMYSKHLCYAFIFSLLFTLLNFDINTYKDTLYISALLGSIYIFIFVTFDYLLKFVYRGVNTNEVQ